MTSRSAGTGRAWAAVFLACGVLSCWIILHPRLCDLQSPFLDGYVYEQYTESGEGLLHGIPPSRGLSPRMPLSSVWGALLFERGGLAWRQAWPSLEILLVALLVYALNAVTGRMALGLAGALAFCLWAAAAPAATWVDHPQPGYAALIMLVACLQAWRARAPTVGRSVLLGLGLGVSILYRSPLILFGPVLVLYELVAVYRCSPRACWRTHLPLLAVPPLCLAPWVATNAMLGRQPFGFEGGAMYGNVITGALGIVQTMQYGMQEVFERAPTHSGAAVLAWAADAVLRHPQRYAAAVVRRLASVASMQPVLVGLAGASLLCGFRRPAVAQPALLAAYFVGIHCLMSIREAYFLPLWPLLAGLAAAWLAPVAARLRRRGGRSGGGRRWAALAEAAGKGSLTRRAAAGMVMAAFLPALALAGYTAAKAIGYARAARSASWSAPGALDAAVEDAPRDGWLLARRGRLRAEQGDYRRAAEDCRASVALQPWRVDRHIDFVWLRMLEGRVRPLRGFRPPWPREGYRSPEGYDYLEARLRLARFAGAWRAGRRQEARAELFAALGIWQRFNEMSYGPGGTADVAGGAGESGAVREALERARSPEGTAPFFAEQVARHYFGDLLSAQEKACLAGLLLESWPGNKALLRLQARLRWAWLEDAVRAGDGKEALAALRVLERVRPSRDESAALRRMASELAAKGAREAAVSLADRAGCSSPEERLSAARLSLELRRPDRALAAIRGMAAAGGPATARQWAEAASLAKGAGDAGLARRSLLRAQAAEPSGEGKLRLAQAHLAAGDREGFALAAASLVESGAAGFPAGKWMELAAKASRLGHAAVALKALGRAEAAGGGAEERLGLADMFRGLGDRKRASGVLRGLGQEPPGALTAGRWLEAASSAARDGEREAALTLLERAQAAGPKAPEMRTIARLHGSSGRPGAALAALRELARERPGELKAEDWLGMAAWAAQVGDRAGAAQSLANAEKAGPSAQEIERIAELHRASGASEAADAVMLRLARERPRALGASDWLEAAAKAARSGDRAGALRALERAQGAGPTGEQGRMIALRFQGLKDYGRAMSLLDALVQEHPGEGSYLSDRGVLKALTGRMEEGIADLAEARRLQPASMETALSLGTALEAVGKGDEALRLYDEVLAGRPARASSEVDELLRAEREKLRSKLAPVR
ncbi:MAG: hypothetical protein HY927_02725 [Elusimicrobia bacterium]|nr:hypothetical protein [Elusimicrobiota bacterium]